MRKTSFLGVLVALCTLALPAVPAHAQASRTWVSGVGDDANPCSRTAPCKTFAGAMPKTATGGEIDALDPGGFGALTITKSITLDGGGGQVASALVSGTNGITVNAPGAIVTLRNLRINGIASGVNGVSVTQVGELHVENLDIFGFTQKGVDFEPTAAGTSHLLIRNTVIQDCVGGAILVKPAAGVSVLGSIDSSSLNTSLYGVRAEDGSKVTINNTVSASNVNNGYLAVATSSPTEINLINSVAANNGINGLNTAGPAGAVIRMQNVIISDNPNGINTSLGGSVIGTAPGSNSNVGNTTSGAPASSTTLQ